VNLGQGCEYVGVIMHEMMHALGKSRDLILIGRVG